MRKPVGLFVAAFATVAGGGLAVAVEGTQQQTDDSTTTTSESTTTSTESTATTAPTTTTIEVESTEADALEGEGGEHGAWVSDHARNLCGEDAVNPDTGEAYANHGECVSRAARDKDHDATSFGSTSGMVEVWTARIPRRAVESDTSLVKSSTFTSSRSYAVRVASMFASR
jgi:hypothetical protein